MQQIRKNSKAGQDRTRGQDRRRGRGHGNGGTSQRPWPRSGRGSTEPEGSPGARLPPVIWPLPHITELLLSVWALLAQPLARSLAHRGQPLSHQHTRVCVCPAWVFFRTQTGLSLSLSRSDFFFFFFFLFKKQVRFHCRPDYSSCWVKLKMFQNLLILIFN